MNKVSLEVLVSESGMQGIQQRAVTDSVPLNPTLSLVCVVLCHDSSDPPVRKQAPARLRMARARLRGSESAEPGTLLQECVGDSDGDEGGDEEGDIYVTFAVRQALCWALHHPGSGG